MSIVAPYFEETFIAGANESADNLDTSPFDQLNERAKEYAENRGAELVGMRFDKNGDLVQNPDARWAITDTTRGELQSLEAQALEEGWSPSDLADEIESLIDDPARAKVIAETDLAKAQQEGSMAEWRESGVVEGKSWLLGNEHGVADECDDNADEGVIGIDETFSSGDDTAPAHPSCDCDVAAEIRE